MTSQGKKLVLMGPPGAGKGTQARQISEQLDIPHLDCGQVLRSQMKESTELGTEAEKFVVTGQLVPDRIIINMMGERMKEPDCENGFLLDGFPRTIEQANGLDSYLGSIESSLNHIIYLGIDAGTAVARLSSRRYCPECAMVFNLVTAPPSVEGKCDNCSADLAQREDDTAETIRERLSVYESETRPLRDFYSSRDGYLELDGSIDAADVTAAIFEVVGPLPAETERTCEESVTDSSGI